MRLLCGVDGAGPDHGESSVSGRLGLEGKDADDTRAADSRCAGRTRRDHSDVSGTVVTVNERDSLAIAVQQVSGGNIEQGKFCRIVLKLDGNGCDISGSAENNRDLEAASGRKLTRRRSEVKLAAGAGMAAGAGGCGFLAAGFALSGTAAPSWAIKAGAAASALEPGTVPNWECASETGRETTAADASADSSSCRRSMD